MRQFDFVKHDADGVETHRCVVKTDSDGANTDLFTVMTVGGAVDMLVHCLAPIHPGSIMSLAAMGMLAAKGADLGIDVFCDGAQIDPTAVAPTVMVASWEELLTALENKEPAITITGSMEIADMLTVDYDCTLTVEAGVELTRPDVTGAATALIKCTGGTLTINAAADAVLGSRGQSTSDWVQAVWCYGGTVVINDGTYRGGIWDNIEDKTTGSSACIYCEKGTVIINGGTFQSGYASDLGGGSYAVLNCLDANYKNGDAAIVVNGGSYYLFNPADNGSEGSGTNFCAEGVTVTQNGDWYVAA